MPSPLTIKPGDRELGGSMEIIRMPHILFLLLVEQQPYLLHLIRVNNPWLDGQSSPFLLITGPKKPQVLRKQQWVIKQ